MTHKTNITDEEKKKKREIINRARSDIRYIEGFFERFELSTNATAEVKTMLSRCQGELIDPKRADYETAEVACDRDVFDTIEFLRNPGGPRVCKDYIPDHIWEETMRNINTRSLKKNTNRKKTKRSYRGDTIIIFDAKTDIPF